MKKQIIQDGNEFYQEMTDKEYIQYLRTAIVNTREAEKILRQMVEEKLGYPITDKAKLSISSQFIKVPEGLYQYVN